MIEQLRENLREIMTAKNPILCWTSGKDSQLLLFLIREIRPIPVLIFPHFWGDKVFLKRILDEWDLKAFFYRPLRFEYKDDSIFAYYPVGKNILPVITDVVGHENKCGLDVIKKATRPTQIPNYDFDVTILGSKKVDSHSLVPTLDFADTTGIECPLWNWTDEQVFEAIDKLGVPIDTRVYVDKQERYSPGNWTGCMNCQKPVEQVFCFKENAMIRGAI